MTLASQDLSDFCLVDERTEPISRQPGFAKHHEIPDSRSTRHLRFIAEIVKPTVEAELESMFRIFREKLSLKRKELTVQGPVDGSGSITTPWFQYEIVATLHEDDLSKIVWHRMVNQISNSDILIRPQFDAAFGNRFSILEMRTSGKMNLSGIVDYLEDEEPASVKLDYDRDVNWLVIRVEDSAAKIRLQRESVRICVDPPRFAKDLLREFINLKNTFLGDTDLFQHELASE